MLNVLLIILISLVGLFIILSFVTGIVLVELCVHPFKFETREGRKKYNIEKGYTVDPKLLKREDVVFKMRDGYEIHGDVSVNNPKKFIIFLHGHTSCREGGIKYARAFADMNYSFVFYDHRGHGDNEKSLITMGFNESKDGAEVLHQIREKYGPDVQIGVFGVSMGGASACMLTKYTQEMDFVILDCPYSSLKDLFVDTCHMRFFPSFLALLIGKAYFKLRYHISFNDVSPMENIKSNKKPLLLIHGDKDEMVSYKCQEKILKNATNCYVENYIFPKATHSNSCVVDLPRYKKIIKDFLNKVDELNK